MTGTYGFGAMAANWMFRRFHKTVRIGYYAVQSGRRHQVLLGGALIAYGLVKGSGRRRLVYKTSIDVGEGATIRVLKGRHPIATTAPIGMDR